MPSNLIEIWKSNTGVLDDNFSLWNTVVDPGIGNPFDGGLDTPVISQELYIYKARRYDATYDAYSAFSPLIYVRGPWPRGAVITMPNTNLGVQTQMGVGIEVTEGQPVQAQKLVDRVSGNLEEQLALLNRRALRNVTAPIGAVPGIATFNGTVVFEPTPEGISILLCSLFGAPTNTIVDAVTGPPAIPAYKINTWKDNFGQLPITISELRGSSHYCYPGVRSSAMNLRLDKTQADPVQISLDMVAMNQLMNYVDADLNIGAGSSASYDTLPAFSPIGGSITIAGTVSADARAFDIRVAKNVGDRQVLDTYRGANGHYIQNTDVSGTATLYFSTEAELRRFMGVGQTQTTPYGAALNNNFFTLVLSLLGGTNPSNVPNLLTMTMTNATYNAVGQAVAGPDAIMQEIRYTAYNDPATGTAVTTAIQNTETLAVITTAGTPLTVVPANAVTAYHT